MLKNSFQDIAGIRSDYQLSTLTERTAGDDPIALFCTWLQDAMEAHISDVNAMTLATVDQNTCPHARIVLLKGIENGRFLFYSNYDSAKGLQLAGNSRAALLFFWKEMQRQVRVEGNVAQLSSAESDAYHNSRPQGSRLSAWASPQSSPIPDREVLERSVSAFEKKFKDTEIPRPPRWGGYSVTPSYIEFWQGRSDRLHDRLAYSLDNGAWSRVRLAP